MHMASHIARPVRQAPVTMTMTKSSRSHPIRVAGKNGARQRIEQLPHGPQWRCENGLYRRFHGSPGRRGERGQRRTFGQTRHPGRVCWPGLRPYQVADRHSNISAADYQGILRPLPSPLRNGDARTRRPASLGMIAAANDRKSASRCRWLPGKLRILRQRLGRLSSHTTSLRFEQPFVSPSAVFARLRCAHGRRH